MRIRAIWRDGAKIPGFAASRGDSPPPSGATYVHVNPRDVEDLGGRFLAGRESVELVPAPIPLEGVEWRILQIIMAPQNRLLAALHHLRDHLQTDLPQAGRALNENGKRGIKI